MYEKTLKISLRLYSTIVQEKLSTYEDFKINLYFIVFLMIKSSTLKTEVKFDLEDRFHSKTYKNDTDRFKFVAQILRNS